MQQTNFILRKDGWLIFLLIVIHTGCWFAMKPIFPASDSLNYFLNARKVLHHEYALTQSVLDHRFGVFVPQAFLINLFGESPYIINLWALLCSLFTIAFIYYIVLRDFKRITAFLAALLLSVNLIQIIFSSVVFADIIASFFSLVCIYIIFIGRKDNANRIKYLIFFVLFFSSGFFSKESIVLILPFIAFVFWSDWKQGKQIFFLRSISISVILVGIVLILVSKFLYNEFFFFLNSNQNYTLYESYLDINSFLKRIAFFPLTWINSQAGYIFIFVFSIPSLIRGLNKKDGFSSIESFFSLYFVMMLLLLWWGSCSIVRLAAVPITDRRWMILIAPICILSAFTIQKIVQEKNYKNDFYFLLFSFCSLSIINWMAFSAQRGKLFLSFAVMLLLQELLRRYFQINNKLRITLIVLPFIILAIHFLRNNSNYVIQSVQ